MRCEAVAQLAPFLLLRRAGDEELAERREVPPQLYCCADLHVLPAAVDGSDLIENELVIALSDKPVVEVDDGVALRVGRLRSPVALLPRSPAHAANVRRDALPRFELIE